MRSTRAARQSAFDFTPTPSTSPLVFQQDPEGNGHFVLIVALLPAFSALMAPFWLLCGRLLVDPATRAVAAERPLSGCLILAGLLMLTLIFGWPLARLVQEAFAGRCVTIEDSLVRSSAVGLLGRRLRTTPLNAYRGLERWPRTTLSDVREELVLVHRDRSHSLVLGPVRHIPEEAIATLTRLFAVAEIPSREPASVPVPHGYSLAAERQPPLAA
ncbi:hypothetical protein [Hyphomicrobium sp. CS1GBMeth3]|uniref:hypothetical protein n=1 Tax=Hyphomicrobium sp. CS1GBMeth3 TaxID=1892845 RepID=UPI0009305437|nr:hypothetical protein [Hyphomicrobium sp. CS1GBMeth3]